MNWPGRLSWEARLDSQPQFYSRPVTELYRSAIHGERVTFFFERCRLVLTLEWDQREMIGFVSQEVNL